MRININNKVSFGVLKISQPIRGDLRGIKKDLGYNTPPYFVKDLAYLTLKYKN